MATLKGKFKPSSAAERKFYSALRKVGLVSGHIIEHYTHAPVGRIDPFELKKMQKALNDYSKLITPWARRQAARLVDQVQKSNKRAYQNKSKVIGKLLDLNVAEAEVGQVALALMNEQVALIKSIPVEAGLRAQKIAFEAAVTGTRAAPDEDTIAELQKQLGLSAEVAVSRAQLIAVTETARANASINQARAMRVGSNQYRWHNSGDEAVRPSHRTYKGKPMQGQIFSWDDPPTLSDGMTGHPGTFPRCRCFAEPIFDTE